MAGYMRRTKTRRTVWILRGALATLGLAGAVYAADQVTAPPAAEDVGKAITSQRVKDGESAQPAPDPEHQIQSLTHEQMLQLAAKYDTEGKVAYEHGETMRIQAYRSRDIIRMTCIDDKLTQMKEILDGIAPRLVAFPRLEGEDLVMRQHFLVMQQAHKRVMELAAELDACMGDVLDSITAGKVKEETPSSENGYDPTHPPAPVHDIERPGEASPYR
jgi:hypothetical protein